MLVRVVKLPGLSDLEDSDLEARAAASGPEPPADSRSQCLRWFGGPPVRPGPGQANA